MKKKHVNSMSYDHVTVVNRYPILPWLSRGTDGQTDRCTVMCNLVPRFHSVLTWEIWVQDYSHVITKISGMDRLPNFLRYGVPRILYFKKIVCKLSMASPFKPVNNGV